MTKPDGSTYVLQKCKILDQGKLEGFVVSCQRMLINSTIVFTTDYYSIFYR